MADAVASGFQKIRVVLAEMPPLLRDIVRDAVASHADIEIVGDLDGRNGPLRAVEGVDVVIVGARQPDDSALAGEVFRTSPCTRVLIIATSGRSAIMWQLRPHKAPLGEVSAASLLAAIRADVDGEVEQRSVN